MTEEVEVVATAQSSEIPIQETAIVQLVKQFPTPIIRAVLDLVQFHASLLDDTKGELDERLEALKQSKINQQAAQEIGIKELTNRESRIQKRIAREIEFLQKKVVALETGFLQMPRFDWGRLEWSSERLPYSTLIRLKEAKESGAFDSFGVVQDKYTRPSRKRDPFLVGIITGERGYEEHFLIGAWK